jgi:large subunit ribosomal protein L22
MELKYSVTAGDKTVKSMGRDLNVSFKNMIMVAEYIRGKMLEKAIADLEQVIQLKKTIPFKRFRAGIGHRKGNTFKTAKYPQKASKYALEILKNMRANAEFKGFDPSKIKIIHSQANHGVSRLRRKPKGRYTTWEVEYCHLQLIGKEM